MKDVWDNSQSTELLEAILDLKNPKEAKRFFRDLLTEKEIVEFSSRWKAAQLLAENTPYTQIQEKTGLSSTTVARISKWLNQGKGGYKLAISRIYHSHHTEKSPSRKRLC